ncbi:MAG: hypothetical protein ACREFB_19010 [Stellaceae bacterium]
MLDTLSIRARTLFAHRDLADLWAVIPEADRRNPLRIASWLSSAASAEPRLADFAPFREAVRAVDAWRSGADLADQASRLYHDPKIRAEFSESELEWAWRNPSAAYQRLISEGAKGGIEDGARVHQILTVIAGARALAEENGIAFGGGAAPAATSIPNDPAQADREYKALVSRPVNELSPTEYQRMAALAEQRADREAAASEREFSASQRPVQPGEYQRLIAASLAGKLTAAETARMSQLAEARAIGDGLIEPADAQYQRTAPQPDTAPAPSTEGSQNDTTSQP